MEEYLQNILAYRLLNVGYGGIEETTHKDGNPVFCPDTVYNTTTVYSYSSADCRTLVGKEPQ